MPFARPTLSELIERNKDDLDARLPGADSRLRRSVLGVLATMHAGGLHGLYGLLDHIARQVMPDTAEAEHLQRWATIWGVSRKPATKAAGTVQATGTNGSIIPVGRLLIRGDQVEFITTAEATIAGGVAALEVEAVNAGAAGATAAGSKLQFVSPVAGVNAITTVDGDGLTGGADEESDASLRGRVLARIRRAPSGGSRADYERWALEVPGVTRAWIYPGWGGAGTVGVTFVMDGRADIIPLPADVDAVEAHLEAERPVTAHLTVFAPTPVALNPEIQLTPNTAPVRAAVEAELRDLLLREAEPGGIVLLSRLNEAISIAAGETDHVLITPAANVALAANEIAVLGAITWS